MESILAKMKLPLEDAFNDIIGKAQRGLELSDEKLAARANVAVADARSAKAGQFDETIVRRLAAVLSLGADALVASGKKTWYPTEPGVIAGLACFNTPFDDMTVNSYLVYDPKARVGAAFDTGADCNPLLEFARRENVKIEIILLTHIHGDHVVDLDRLAVATKAKAYVSEREPIDGAEPFADGHVFGVGSLRIEARRTSGHARGGVTFVVSGLSRQLAVVGDAVFAGSMGGGMVSYAEALRTNRENILSLSDDTILCPGHGPLTTVGEEKQHNPFFALKT
jgi:hydroxyacylglutathione hydrolase